MPLVIEELSLIHVHRTRKSVRRPAHDQICAVCKSDAELISLAAAARISRVDPENLCDAFRRSMGLAGEDIREKTLVCLDCLFSLPACATGKASLSHDTYQGANE